MIQTLILLSIAFCLICLVFLLPIITEFRRDRIRNKPFPPRWKFILRKNFLIYKSLPKNLQSRLKGHIQVFMAEKQFIGCDGLELNDDIKVTIAAIACLLLLNERGEYYPKLRSILVYPTAYMVTTRQAFGDYGIAESKEARLGESRSRDLVILSWEQIKYDLNHWQDGHNVILHEFAHQLDQEDGIANGVPILSKKQDYLNWAKFFTREYKQLIADVKNGQKTVMYSYATTNPAEFFAVATETFFEKPQEMEQNLTNIYNLLKNYYKLDPTGWF
ncbi:MAG: zinc-dependent peptidase [Prochloraceae cyanobacterium]|nr:zinc-dependent peptidase [Prochloraceae cyanobacterium]